MVELLAAKKQTVDERLEFLMRVADGPLSRQFSRPLRAYVAFWAARLHMEQGQVDRHERMLALALQLDPTNKAAAAATFSAISVDPDAALSDKAAALFTLFNADPLDPNTHEGIGNTLLAYGLYGEAFLWLSKSAELRVKLGGSPDVTLLQSTILAAWGDGNFETAQTILDILDPPRDPVAEQSDDWPPVDVLMLKAAVLTSKPNPGDLTTLHARIEKRLIDRTEGGQDTVAMANLVWSHLLLNKSLGAVPGLIDRIEAASGAKQDVLRGWLAVREGDAEAARSTLEPIKEIDHRAALGLALLPAEHGDGERVRLLMSVAQRSPEDIFGLMAVSRLRDLGVVFPESEDRVLLARLFGKLPGPMLEMEANPMRYLQLKVEPVKQLTRLGEPFEVSVQLRNVSQRPLSLGLGGTVPTQLMLLPKVKAGMEPASSLGPLTIDLHRRLRLDSGSVMSLTIPLETTHPIGAILSGVPTSHVQLDVVAVLNPYITEIGGVRSGLMGTTTQFRNMSRRATAINDKAVEGLIRQIGGADDQEALLAMVILGPWAGGANEDETRMVHVPKIAEAMSERFATLTPIQQALAVMSVPRREFGEEHFSAILERAAQSDRVDVRVAYIATRVKQSDHPVLTAALREPSGVVRDFADASLALVEMAEEQKAAMEAQQEVQEGFDPVEIDDLTSPAGK